MRSRFGISVLGELCVSSALAALLVTACPVAAQTNGTDGTEAHEYIIRSGDLLRIAVWPDSTFGGQYPVEETGSVFLPLIGEMSVEGMPISRLRTALRERYGETLRSPVVSVTPLFNVTVLGAVQRPGLYQAQPSQSLFAVISQAGGFTSRAKEGDVRIVRRGRVIEVDLETALEEGGADLDLALQSGDRIIVPEGWGFNMRDLLWGLQTVAVIWTLVDRAGN